MLHLQDDLVLDVETKAKSLGLDVRAGVKATKAWCADLLLYRGAACVNVEVESRWPRAAEVVRRARERLLAGAWTFWLFERNQPALKQFGDLPFVVSRDRLFELLEQPIPYLAPLPETYDLRTFNDEPTAVPCEICAFPRLPPRWGAFCWRCRFGVYGAAKRTFSTPREKVLLVRDAYEFTDADVKEFQAELAALRSVRVSGIYRKLRAWRQ